MRTNTSDLRFPDAETIYLPIGPDPPKLHVASHPSGHSFLPSPMRTVPLKLVTLVCEPVLESRLTTELKALGATGFTIVEGRGEGSRGMHAGELPGENRRIETIVSPAVADRIVAHVAEQYFENYAILCYVLDAAVVRADKFAPSSSPTR